MFFKPKISLLCLALVIYSSVAMAGKTVPLKELAQQGDAEAQYLMGKQHINGTFGSQDYVAAEHWFRLSAGQGHANGMFGLAWIMDRRAETHADEVEIVRLLYKAADKGVPGAQYYLASYTLKEKGGLSRDVDAAVTLLKKAAARHYTDANALLVRMTHDGQCDQKTGETALQGLEEMAEKGNAVAQYFMGRVNELGLTIPVNLEKAMFWYTKAASEGYGTAHTRMGEMYESGSGTAQDFKKAKTAYEAAIANGDFTANWNIARLYEAGNGVAQSQKTAASFYLEAAKKGHLQSMSAYGIMLAQGNGVPQNDAAAAQWLEQAAAWGDAEAQYALGKMYQAGLIPQRPLEQGPDVAWHKKKHWRPGGFDRHWSQHWFKKAAAQGHEAAKNERERESTVKGWFFLAIGVFSILFSIAGFWVPHILAPGRSPFMARFVGAPLTFLLGIFMIVEAIRSLAS